MEVMAVGRVTEMQTRLRQQLTFAAGAIVDRQDFQPLEPNRMVPQEMLLQLLTQITLAMAVAEQHHPIGLPHRLADLLQERVVKGRPLAGNISVMAMAQALARAP